MRLTYGFFYARNSFKFQALIENALPCSIVRKYPVFTRNLPMIEQRTKISSLICYCLATCLLIPAVSGCGNGCKVLRPIETVIEYVVGIANEAGDYVIGTAKTLADALDSAWRAFWGPVLINNVEVDKNDPLKGRYNGTLMCSAVWGPTDEKGEAQNRLLVTLDDPAVVQCHEQAETVLFASLFFGLAGCVLPLAMNLFSFFVIAEVVGFVLKAFAL